MNKSSNKEKAKSATNIKDCNFEGGGAEKSKTNTTKKGTDNSSKTTKEKTAKKFGAKRGQTKRTEVNSKSTYP